MLATLIRGTLPILSGKGGRIWGSKQERGNRMALQAWPAGPENTVDGCVDYLRGFW